MSESKHRRTDKSDKGGALHLFLVRHVYPDSITSSRQAVVQAVAKDTDGVAGLVRRSGLRRLIFARSFIRTGSASGRSLVQVSGGCASAALEEPSPLQRY
jgi:hypothetical protein